MLENSVQFSGVVDALPYVDAGYDAPGVRDAVAALVEEEMKRYQPSKDYLQYLPRINAEKFQTERMKIELKRMDENKPMEKLDFKKYQQTKPAVNRRRDPTAWEECYNRVAILHSHMTNRLANLQLQADYGAEVWRQFIPTMERQLKLLESELRDTRNRIQEVNWDRKNSQLKAGEQLALLENSWVELVGKNFEIERACLEMEARIEEWERFHEAKEQAKAEEEGASPSEPSDSPRDEQEVTRTSTEPFSEATTVEDGPVVVPDADPAETSEPSANMENAEPTVNMDTTNGQ